MDSKQIVEIKGIKMEVDYREGTSTRVDTFKVGTKVKLLTKGYGGDYSVRPGIIVGFDQFKQLPSIKVMVVNAGYAGGVEYVSFNEGLKDAELISAEDDEELIAKKDAVIGTLSRDVETKRVAYEAAQDTLRLFQKHYGAAQEKAESVV